MASYGLRNVWSTEPASNSPDRLGQEMPAGTSMATSRAVRDASRQTPASMALRVSRRMSNEKQMS
jgi:hypothetical protein